MLISLQLNGLNRTDFPFLVWSRRARSCLAPESQRKIFRLFSDTALDLGHMGRCLVRALSQLREGPWLDELFLLYAKLSLS